ncbi:polyketide synthase [Cellulosilyticum ruminicola]|uniref:polyketide synthase n=1 Tax=Cellulosilyticum ruminicola TaxID=425254 RepID=UPI0006D0A6E8|nr:polyketide synthase [Cellulosilyticum ruminicola]
MNNKSVEVREIEKGIKCIYMQERAHKNTFTPELIKGLEAAFRECEEDLSCKVIILTGYDSYFASGGTQEDLLAIQEGRAKFTDANSNNSNVYSMPLECKLPVISAMQGHAIGGGLALGLFSDFVILSKESIYAASFMKYGFTPGFGATYVIPLKLGMVLGEDLLMTAKTYHGEDLRKRGVPFEVYPRKEVLQNAIELAKVIAEKPRISLITLKQHLVREHKEKLQEKIKQELEMHEITFHLPEVKEKIMTMYDK